MRLKSLPTALMQKVVGSLTPSRVGAAAAEKYVYAPDCDDPVARTCLVSTSKFWKVPAPEAVPERGIQKPSPTARRPGPRRLTTNELLTLLAARVAEKT